MNEKDRRLLQIALMDESKVRKLAKSHQPGLTRVISRLLIRYTDSKVVDFPGQKREKNGQFGEGKQGNSTKKKSTKTKKAGIIRSDTHGNRWDQPTKTLPLAEYRKVLSAIDTHFSEKFKGMSIAKITINSGKDKPAYDYYFQIREYDDYPDINIIAKRRNKD